MNEAVNIMSGRSDEDLVAAIVGSTEMARMVLDATGGLKFLARSGLADLTEIEGVSESKARSLFAAIEMGLRSVEWPSQQTQINCSADVYRLLRGRLGLLHQEVMIVLLLNNRNEVVSQVTVAKGSNNSCAVEAREVLRPAVQNGSARIVMVHNHPSGDSTPSPNDVALTRRVAEACELIGIPLLDHVVIGRGSYASLRDLGLLKDTKADLRAVADRHQ